MDVEVVVGAAAGVAGVAVVREFVERVLRVFLAQPIDTLRRGLRNDLNIITTPHYTYMQHKHKLKKTP